MREYNRVLIMSLVKSIFEVDYITDDIFDMYIDLDSCLSILTSMELPDDREEKIILVKELLMQVANFIDMWKNRANLKFYYSFKRTKIFNKYIPEWDEQRNKRLDSGTPEFIVKQVINKMKKISLSNITITECGDSTILYIFRDINKLNLNGYNSLIISRDVHYQCLFRHLQNIEIYNGKHIIDAKTFRHLKDKNKYPDLSVGMLPYYYLLKGLERHSYKGVPKYGSMNSLKYCKAHQINILQNKDDLINEYKEKLKVMLIKGLEEEL